MLDRFSLGKLALSDIGRFTAAGGPKSHAYETLFGNGFRGAAEARRSLSDYGNMSAASVLFVLDRLIASTQGADEEWGCALLTALGPGFSAGFVVLARQ